MIPNDVFGYSARRGKRQQTTSRRPSTTERRRADRPESGDRRVRRTRRLLQEALRSLVLEKGYDAVTIQDILDRADVARATLYAHFRDKDDLMMSRFEAVRGSLGDHLAGFVRSGAASMRDVVRALFEHAAEHRAEYRSLVGSRSGSAILAVVTRQLVKLVREHFRDAVAARELRPAVPVDIVASYVVSAFVAMMTQWLDSPQSHTAADMAQMFQRLTLPAVSAGLNMHGGDRPRS
jgi:AcrR family transcriptional regulator|nr:TetR/AcrR family transcriptional regulator [Kofleriaceae bacterium]